ncbi:MAG: glycosyltransferase family 2 protein [Sorangiineae bacterium]|nr:glycosyltransferase family 2 protein [Polyangiaceae bacterium]MEB2321806.1 glycosyltransferase family 2 protein [Sorangiineae bacterium]
MKLIIQIPCLNEREHLGETFADLPRRIPGVDEIEVLVVDDGSTDGTSDYAAELGVHHVVRFPVNRGLSAAFTAGMDASLRLGADLIVNTDADHQYAGDDIARLLEPILSGEADVVVGDRDPANLAHFSPPKRLLQAWGSRLVRAVSATRVADSTSGFRAYSRKAALSVFVHNRFTYTLETIIQAGRTGIATANVRVRTNEKTRESRLFSSIPQYLRRNGPVIFRSYGMYRPFQSFAYLALALLVVGLFGVGRFLYFYLVDPSYSGHTQSLVLGVGAVTLAFMVGVVALVGELIAANRRLVEEVLVHVRRLDADRGVEARARGAPVDGIRSTGAATWRRAEP